MKLTNSYNVISVVFIFITIIFIASILLYIISDSSVVHFICKLCNVQICIMFKEFFCNAHHCKAGQYMLKNIALLLLWKQWPCERQHHLSSGVCPEVKLGLWTDPSQNFSSEKWALHKMFVSKTDPSQNVSA